MVVTVVAIAVVVLMAVAIVVEGVVVGSSEGEWNVGDLGS